MAHDSQERVTGRPSASPTEDASNRGASKRLVLATAWSAVLLTTGIPIILANEVFLTNTQWITLVQVGLLCGLLVLTRFDKRFHSLQLLALSLLVVKAMKNLPVEETHRVIGLVLPFELGQPIVGILFKGVIGIMFLVVLLAAGMHPGELFLRKSDLSVIADRQRVPGFRRERPWWKLGAVWGGLTVLTTLVFLLIAGANVAFWDLPGSEILALGALITVVAAVNAFQEEFVFRAAPLSQITEVIGKNHAMVLLGSAFGLSHYYGTPGGVPGIFMTLFLGWWLSKSILETRGITLAWFVHFLLDVVILTAWLLT